MSTRTRWAIAGTGSIAERTITDLHLTENVDVVAVSSRTPRRADGFASRFGIARPFGDYLAMLDDPEIDVVYICTPHGSHFDMVAQAIEHGKNVLCEKPLTVDATQSRRLIKLAAEGEVFLMEAMWMKFNPTIRLLQEIIAEGTIGPVRHVTAGFGFQAPRIPGSRLWDTAQGGGALLDLGVYPIAFAEMFLGRTGEVTVRSVFGSIQNDGLDTTAIVTLSGDQAAAQIATSIEHTVVAAATIAGTEGFVTVDMPFFNAAGFDVYPEGRRPGAAPPWRMEMTLEGNGYVPMFRAVSDAVMSGLTEHSDHTLLHSINTLELVDEIRRKLLASSPLSLVANSLHL